MHTAISYLLSMRWIQECAERRGWEVLEALDTSLPANAELLAAVECEVNLRLPNDFLHVLAHHSAKITLSWLAENPETAPHGEFEAIYQGGVEEGLWDVNSVVSLKHDWEGWKDTAGGPETDEFKIWDRAIPFACSDGNFLALAAEPNQDTYPVVYLHHEGDLHVGHGRILAPSFIEFIERWSSLGCPGLDFESFELFLDEGGI